MSADEKQKSHQRILKAASRLFRERGIETTSVADVMKAAGLTHGGFYRHFDSKEALVAAAFSHAVDEVVSEVEATPAGPERDAARDLYVARYLSTEHLDGRGEGCPLAAMGAEIVRLGGAAEAEASDAVERMARLLTADDRGTSDKGVATMALLLGTITLARLAKSRELSDTILDAGKRGTALLDQRW
ncbi:TetR family transcriptional regulator [Alphaproteobacteria bacterium GH1-50]|uniref:TetR family transcriptional regulator n=1 Tax=Kangsaoukella pontilimi TaxID=2691042 RepID=A0A7C9NFY1_9RHOB|nr:TetR/AcrR family transcriptional regulator [Kangsaoukella pontilimi]MXQ09039.1 TetR family transcriptional regulator [Kangsaoukella pontilimi]